MKRAAKRSPAASLVLAIVVKPYAVLFVPWLAARRQAPSIVTALAGFAISAVAAGVLYGWDGNIGSTGSGGEW